MKLWKNVLVHVDSRENALEALGNSVRVAEAFNGRVIAFDAVSSSARLLSLQYPTLRTDHLQELARTARTEELRDTVAELELGVPFETIVGRGSPGRALLGYAERNADLIVKTVAPADVEDKTARGVVATQLLREAQVPVWLSPPGRPPVRRVVAAVNLWTSQKWRQRLDERVVLAAARLSLVQNAELHVVCIADRLRDDLYRCMLGPEQFKDFLVQDRKELRRALDDLLTRIGPHSVPHLVEGNPLSAIEKIAVEMDADVVVVGRDGGGTDASLRGESMAERLFARLNRSLLLVPPDVPFVSATATPWTLESESAARDSYERAYG